MEALFFHMANAKGGESYILYLRMLCEPGRALGTSASVYFIPPHRADCKTKMNLGLVPAEPTEVQCWELLLGICQLISF